MPKGFIDASLAAIFVSLFLAPGVFFLTKIVKRYFQLRSVGAACEEKWAALPTPVSHFFGRQNTGNGTNLEPTTLKQFFRGIHLYNLTGMVTVLCLTFVVAWFLSVFLAMSFWDAKAGVTVGLKVEEFRNLIAILATWLVVGVGSLLALLIAQSFLSRAHANLQK